MAGEFCDHVHVILVEPEDSLNIGAVARAMDNLGFSHLHLVNPRHFEIERASVSACGAAHLLKDVVVHDSLLQALQEMEDVFGFSVRTGKNRPPRIPLAEFSVKMSQRPPRKTALLFGAEDSGLRQEDMMLCRELVYIPANPGNRSFNLAQAVLLALYELARGPESNQAEDNEPRWATGHDFQQLDRLIDEMLRQSGFFHENTPGQVPGVIKNLFRRLELSQREMQLLLGTFGSISRAIEKCQTQD